jgi:hypothetical protein
MTTLGKYKANGCPVMFEDETYIHSSHITPKNWTDDNTSGSLAQTSEGERVIIIHNGGKSGFI